MSAAHADHLILTEHGPLLRLERLAGLAFAVLAGQFMAVIMLAASMAPGYDLSGGAISDLGTIPETAMLFNASLVVTGVLNVIGGALWFRLHRRLLVLAPFLLAGIGAIGAGLVPLDRGGLHGLFALVAFVFFNLEIVAGALLVDRLARALGLLLGALGLAYVAIMAIGDAGNPAIFGAIGHGGAERLIAYPPMLWLMVLGGYLMGRASVPRPPA